MGSPYLNAVVTFIFVLAVGNVFFDDFDNRTERIVVPILAIVAGGLAWFFSSRSGR